jgi:DNA polymerase-1
VRIDRALLDGGHRSRLVLQVHDEVLVEAPVEERTSSARW